jgi:hypothetical protein
MTPTDMVEKLPSASQKIRRSGRSESVSAVFRLDTSFGGGRENVVDWFNKLRT